MTPASSAALAEYPIPDQRVPRFEMEEWREEFGLVAGITGRELDFRLDGSAGHTTQSRPAWQRFGAVMASGFSGVAASNQVHGITIQEYDSAYPGVGIATGTDGHVTGAEGLLLAITVADCVPVYVVHPQSMTLGLLHAGWRGTAAGILEAGVERVCRTAEANPVDLVIHCGVGICGVCYSVGSDVFTAVTGLQTEGPARLDLRRDLARRAESMGVGRVTVSAWCTAHDHELFHSHRRWGTRAGRMLAFLGRPAA